MEMNNRRPKLVPRLRMLDSIQLNMNDLEEQLRRYRQLNNTNVQYSSSRSSGFARYVPTQPRIPPSSSASIPYVSISTANRPISIVFPNNSPLNSSSSARFSAANLSAPKPKTPNSFSSAGRELGNKTGIGTMSSGYKSGARSSSSQMTDDEDVIYLYSVDCTPAGTIVEEIDLENDLRTTSIPPRPRSEPNPVGLSAVPNAKSSRKRKAPNARKQSSKRANKDYEPKCCSCGVKYDDLAGQGKCLYVTRCGHVVCHPCVEGDGQSCKVCGKEVNSYRKLYL